MSYLKYQKPCFNGPQPLEFNAINIRNTIPYRKVNDPLEYKYACYRPINSIPKRSRVLEHFDFSHDLVDYKPTNCMFTVSGAYLCTNN